jgi:hypothetical protein
MTRPGNAPAYEDDSSRLEDQAGRARRGDIEGLISKTLPRNWRAAQRPPGNQKPADGPPSFVEVSAQPRRRSSGWIATIGSSGDEFPQ